MKLKTLAIFETIFNILLGIIQLPFFFIYVFSRWIAGIFNFLKLKFGRFLLKRSSEFKNDELDQRMSENKLVTAAYAKKALEHGVGLKPKDGGLAAPANL